MIVRVELKNYRSHKHVDLEIHAGVTALIGDNDSGKSSILDAIISTCLGEPWEDVRPKDKETGELIACDDTEVTLTWKDGRTLMRSYDGKKYRTVLTGSNGQVLMDAKTLPDVKETVREFTGVMPLKDRNDNLYPQIEELDEAPFLLSRSTPEALQRRLTAIVPGAAIQAAASSLTLELRKRQAETNAAFQTKERSRQNLETAKASVAPLADLLTDVASTQEALTKVSTLRGHLVSQLDKLDTAAGVAMCLEQTLEPLKESNYEELVTARTGLATSISLLQNFEIQHARLEKMKQGLAKMEATQEVADHVQALQDRKASLDAKQSRLKTSYDVMYRAAEQVCEDEDALEAAQAELAKVPICEVCGGYLQESTTS